jgi:predicted DNA-binding transcriptional regulator AlpA
MSKESTKESPLITAEELVDALRLPSKNWIYQRIHTKNLPFDHIKIGHYLRFRADDVRKYIESQTRQGSTE